MYLETDDIPSGEDGVKETMDTIEDEIPESTEEEEEDYKELDFDN